MVNKSALKDLTDEEVRFLFLMGKFVSKKRCINISDETCFFIGYFLIFGLETPQ